MSLENTPEFKHHLKTLPLIDEVYKEVFKDVKIKRFNFEDKFILDKEYHIDTELTLKNGSKILGQEKCLTYQFAKYKTFTTEFYQNLHTKEKGEFFNLGAQFYFHSYANEDATALKYWCIVRILDLINWLSYQSEEELSKFTRPAGGSRASFLYVPYEELPSEIILAKNF